MEGLPDSFWTPHWTCRLCNAAGRWLEQSSCTCGRAKDQNQIKGSINTQQQIYLFKYGTMWLYGEYILEQIGKYKLNHNRNFIQWFKYILANFYTDFVHEFTLKKTHFIGLCRLIKFHCTLPFADGLRQRECILLKYWSLYFGDARLLPNRDNM